MSQAFTKILQMVLILLLPIPSFGAEAIKFRPVLSVYSDDKGAGLNQPEGVACSQHSLFLVADTGNDRLLQYTFQEDTLKGGAEIKVAELTHPIRVQTNSKGETYVLDGKQRRIVRLSHEGTFKGYLDPEGLPPPKAFVPRSFKIDMADNIYILDIGSERVIVLDSAGKYLHGIAFPENYGFMSDLSVDLKGKIFLIDSIHAVVFVASRDSIRFSPLTKSLKEQIDFPASITTDARGMLYLVDRNDSSIFILGPDGSFQGRRLSAGWKEGLLRQPSELCMNEMGEAFIADRGNNRIQIFTVVR